MNTPRNRPSHRWRTVGLLALLALAPKCLLCLAGYLGAGALLGSRAVELCGAPPAPAASNVLSATGVVLLSAFGVSIHLARRHRPVDRARKPAPVVS